MKRFTLLFFVLAALTISQTRAENWMPLSRTNDSTIYLDADGISKYNNGDFFVWVIQEYTRPIKIESVDGKIYKAKTYYLFNKELRRYSFQQIIYYDRDGNVLKSFSYGTTAKVQPYRYNYPIMPNTNEETILNKLLELTSADDKQQDGD